MLQYTPPYNLMHLYWGAQVIMLNICIYCTEMTDYPVLVYEYALRILRSKAYKFHRHSKLT
jgi:hypothetical protein